MSAKRLLRNPDRSQTCSLHIWIATSHIREPRDEQISLRPSAKRDSQNSKTEKALTITKSSQKFAKKHFMTILRVSLFYQTKHNAQKTFSNQYFTSFHLGWGNLISRRQLC